MVHGLESRILRFLRRHQYKRVWYSEKNESGLVGEVVGLKSDPEFRSALVGYLEWGTRLAVINSRLTENPMGLGEPLPKWGWGETGGPYTPDPK